MQHFCLNDCFPLESSKYDLTTALKDSFIEYNKLKAMFPLEIDGIVTQAEPRETYLNGDRVTLLECIEDLDKSLRISAYRVFSKFPIESLLVIKNVDDLIDEDYSLYISERRYNAINAKIVIENEGFLFSLGIHSDLRKDTLQVTSNNTIHRVCNLFGTEENSEFLENQIRACKNSKLGKFDYFLTLFKDPVHSGRFRKGFESAPVLIQEAIIQQFKEAIKRNGLSPFYADGSLIKDVTHEKEAKIKVFELRIFEPAAFRVYFHECLDTVYLAIVELKPAKKSQSNHIQSAHDIIHELKITK